jgi:hypothetical protein
METDPKIESNFEVDDPEIKRLLREMGFIIGAGLPKGWGFALFLFDFSQAKNGSCFYISSAERDGVLKMLVEFIERQIKTNARS